MKIAEGTGQELDRFNILAKSYGTVFNSLEWMRLFDGRVRHYGFYEDNGALVGGFSIYEEQRFGMSFYRNPPFTPRSDLSSR